MKIEGTHSITSSRERVFELLTDPQALQRFIPGGERLEKTGDNVYALTIRAGVGAVKGIFTGNVRLEDLRPPDHYRMVIDGKGTPGFLKGSGVLELEQQGETTIVSYSGDIQVGGTIASVGQRMLQATAKMMATQFFTALATEAQAHPDKPPPQHDFFRTTLRWFSGWLRRLLKRQSVPTRK